MHKVSRMLCKIVLLAVLFPGAGAKKKEASQSEASLL